jgi:transposase
MHIDIIPNRGSAPAVLLRESYRDGKTVRKRTLANLSELPLDQVEAIRLVLRGQRIAPVADLFEISSSRHHGHVQAVLTAMRRLGMESIISSRPCRERDLVLGMIAARILEPNSKLGTTRWWKTTTLPGQFGIAAATETELYAAMDWLYGRQEVIEKKLAARHFSDGSLVLYDLSSSYVTGQCCPLAARGYSRDGQRGTLQVNYGLVTDARGCPISVTVHKGNTTDPKTLVPQVETARRRFGITRMVVVADRGMLGQKQVDALRDMAGINWITALKHVAIRELVESGKLQLGLFDERNLFELESDVYPGERLVACRNPELAQLRAHKRDDLIAATKEELDKVRGMVERGKLNGADAIGVRVGKVINKYKMAKHLELTIGDTFFSYAVKQEAVAAEAALDGIYVIRTSLPLQDLSADDAVRSYKQLSNTERAFRTMKGVDLMVRPIHHRVEQRVRTHIFLCMLSYYVEWHMREAWRSILFSDEDLAAKETRDPVAPAQRSAEAKRKALTKHLVDGNTVHSFRTLIKDLGTIVRNRCHAKNNDGAEFELDTIPTPEQQHALDLVAAIVAAKQPLKLHQPASMV